MIIRDEPFNRSTRKGSFVLFQIRAFDNLYLLAKFARSIAGILFDGSSPQRDSAQWGGRFFINKNRTGRASGANTDQTLTSSKRATFTNGSQNCITTCPRRASVIYQD